MIMRKLFYKLKQIINYFALKEKNFTIISDNCFAGFIYQKYGLQYQSPTIGCMMFGDDYIEFCNNLDCYTTGDYDFKFITKEESKYNYLIKKIPKKYPIAILNNKIEIHFLHYNDCNECIDKWIRRCSRINKDKLVFKISEREGYTKENLKQFCELNVNKIIFSFNNYPDSIRISELEKLYKIGGDEYPFIIKKFNSTKYLNNCFKDND